MDRCSDVLQRGFKSKELRSFSELYVVVVFFRSVHKHDILFNYWTFCVESRSNKWLKGKH